MAINFDSLPNNNPGFSITPKGRYYAKIEKAEMKQGKDVAKPPYLNLVYALTDSDGQSKGKFFDMLTEPEHDITRYKVKRFIEALKLPITGEFTLKDLSKMVINKSFIVDITVDEKQEPARSQVDVFSGEIFYPMSRASELMDGGLPTCTTGESINGSDAEDGEAHDPETGDAPPENY